MITDVERSAHGTIAALGMNDFTLGVFLFFALIALCTDRQLTIVQRNSDIILVIQVRISCYYLPEALTSYTHNSNHLFSTVNS